MRIALTEEQDMLVEALRKALAAQAPLEEVRRWLDAGDPSPFEAWLAEGGWSGIGVSEDAGGQGGGLLEVALVAEELARGAAPSARWTASAIVAPLLVGAPAALGALAEGEGAAVVMDAGRPPAAPAGVVVEGGRLSGTVDRVLGGDRAGSLVVGAGDGSWWVVAADADGVVVVPTALMDRTRSLARVSLDGVVGEPLDVDDPAAAWAGVRARTAVLLAAGSLGASQRMLEMTVAYTLQREQFGVPIGSFQAVKHAAAQMLVDIEPVRSVVRVAAWTAGNRPEEAALPCAVAKAQAGAAGVRVAERALMLHGAIGVTWEHDLQLLYKRAKLDAALHGDATAWNDLVADLLDLVPA